ncbi:MAG: zf-HC2 domain-containing protein [Candidatus Omnitrophota bacterium]
MNNHATYNDLADFMLGRMDEAQKEALAAHLQECALCSQRMDHLQWAKSYLLSLSQNLDNEHPHPELVVAYLHGELEPELAQWVERHLDFCQECLLTDEVVNDAFAPRTYEQKYIEENFPAAVGEAAAWERIQRHSGALTQQGKRILSLHELCSKVGDRLHSLRTIKDYFFPQPIALTGLAPALTSAEYAAPGEGFEEERIETGESPFFLTLIKFGKEYRINVKSDDPAYQEGLLLVQFLEEAFARMSALIPLQKGEGEYRLAEEERMLAAAIKHKLQVRIAILWPLADLRKADREKAACSFVELLAHHAPEIRISALKILSHLGVKSILSNLASLKDDPDENVRNAAMRAMQEINGS